MLKRALICILIVLLVTGCSKAMSSIPPTPTAAPATPLAAASAVASPNPSPFPSLPAVTPTSSASPTPFTPFTVKPLVDNLKLRVNPGFLFETLILLQQTDTLTVLGMAPGGEWIYVKNEAGNEGWVFAELLASSVDVRQVPVREPKGVLVIKGLVKDANGLPIQGVGFDVNQGATAGEPSGNNVNTDPNGMFYAFLPDSASGAWTVSYGSIACRSNVWSDTSCSTYKQGYTGNVDPISQTVNLPQSGEPLAFTWR